MLWAKILVNLHFALDKSNQIGYNIIVAYIISHSNENCNGFPENMLVWRSGSAIDS